MRTWHQTRKPWGNLHGKNDARAQSPQLGWAVPGRGKRLVANCLPLLGAEIDARVKKDLRLFRGAHSKKIGMSGSDKDKRNAKGKRDGHVPGAQPSSSDASRDQVSLARPVAPSNQRLAHPRTRQRRRTARSHPTAGQPAARPAAGPRGCGRPVARRSGSRHSSTAH